MGLKRFTENNVIKRHLAVKNGSIGKFIMKAFTKLWKKLEQKEICKVYIKVFYSIIPTKCEC